MQSFLHILGSQTFATKLDEFALDCPPVLLGLFLSSIFNIVNPFRVFPIFLETGTAARRKKMLDLYCQQLRCSELGFKLPWPEISSCLNPEI